MRRAEFGDGLSSASGRVRVSISRRGIAVEQNNVKACLARLSTDHVDSCHPSLSPRQPSCVLLLLKSHVFYAQRLAGHVGLHIPLLFLTILTRFYALVA